MIQYFNYDYKNEISSIIQKHQQGNYFDTLTRYSYIGEGSHQYLKLVNREDYTSYDREFDLLNNLLPEIKRFITTDNLQLINLGVGDGLKAAKIISYLKRIYKLSYIGLDLSLLMLWTARYNHSQKKLKTENYYLQCNFTNSDQLEKIIERLGHNEKLFISLGNTITNEVNIANYLQFLKTTSEDGGTTHLLVGLELSNNNVDEIIKEYRNEENYDLTMRPLQMIGINRADGEVIIDYNKKLQRIEEWFVAKIPKRISIRSQEIDLNCGDRILLSITWKPTMAQVRKIIVNNGWKEEAMIINDSGDYILMLLSAD